MDKHAKRQWLVHAIATCHDCSWSEQGHTIAVRKGRYHAQKTGHTVNIETGYSQIYNPKKESDMLD